MGITQKGQKDRVWGGTRRYESAERSSLVGINKKIANYRRRYRGICLSRFHLGAFLFPVFSRNKNHIIHVTL